MTSGFRMDSYVTPLAAGAANSQERPPRMTERTIIVTLSSITALALLAWANATIFWTLIGASAAWCLIIWAVFIRNPKKGRRHEDA
jgi:hypothetical protein